MPDDTTVLTRNGGVTDKHEPKPQQPKTEVVPRAKRRTFTAAYKLRILKEADQCTEPGEVGALLRREGLYSSNLSLWRRQRQQGQLQGLKPRKRGRKKTEQDAMAQELEQLRREKAQLEQRAREGRDHHRGPKKTLHTTWGDAAGEHLQRREVVEAAEGLAERVGTTAACEALGVPRSSYYWMLRARERDAESRPRPKPARALSEEEKHEVREVLNSERFQDAAPRQVWAALLDEGRYLCSWRTMYRILEEHGEVRERRNQLRHPVYQKPELLATGPNELWSWDITKLKGPATWTYYYLYVILDVFSRYAVGWMVAEKESATLARELIETTCARQGVDQNQLVLHSDRGPSMTSKSVAMLLADLGVTKTHSRPYVSNDNPFSEAQFKTMKYRPDFPDRFGSMQDVRGWARAFFRWYHHEHHHTGLGLMTPAMVHYGVAEEAQARRGQVLRAAYASNPERFVRGVPSPPDLPEAVWINEPKNEHRDTAVLL